MRSTSYHSKCQSKMVTLPRLCVRILELMGSTTAKMHRSYGESCGTYGDSRVTSSRTLVPLTALHHRCWPGWTLKCHRVLFTRAPPSTLHLGQARSRLQMLIWH